MNFIIGDIHGELTKLKALIRYILLRDPAASFIFIGDYLDKGEDPFATLQYLDALASENSCVFLRGNHEYYWELLQDNSDSYAAYLTKYGGKNTSASVAGAQDLLTAKKNNVRYLPLFFRLP